MGRPSEGWKLRARRGVQHVRFTHAGKPYELTTGERDPARAGREAADIYARVVSGRWRPSVRVDRETTLKVLIAEWRADLEADHDAGTAYEYFVVARAHWLTRWTTLDEITTEAVKDYTRDALRRVVRSSVRKELSALRNFLAWCVEKKALDVAPEVPEPPPKSVGVRAATTRKRAPIALTESDVEALIAELERDKVHSRARGRPVRDYVIVLWDTGLRRSTVARLRSPEHFAIGHRTLSIAREIDKGRFDRVLDLAPRTYDALARHAKKPGVIFGSIDCRRTLQLAAIAALGKKKGERVTYGDFRHNRITGWTEVSKNLAGIQYLAGHKYASTTARYVHPSREAARDVQRAARGRAARAKG